MYNSNNLATRIKNRAKEQSVLLRDMLDACELNINSLSQMTDKKGLSSFALARIADYLDCSVDYLLGRTDIPEVNRGAVPESTHLIKFAARAGGGIKEVVLTDSQIEALKNLSEVTDLD
ncbi:MAG: hypothetical protein IJX39_04560 [Clostridia bacterium]|nr:hypothetical protein [Clostridia bacterium]